MDPISRRAPGPPRVSSTASSQSASESVPGTRDVIVVLDGDEFGQFAGAVVRTPVDASTEIFKDDETASRTRANMKRLIAQGRIRYNPPGYQMQIPQDYFDPQGRPYVGAVVWEDGRMRIERVKLATG